MPKLASDYRDNYSEVYSFSEYRRHRAVQYSKYRDYSGLRNANRPIKKPNKKRNLVQFMVSCSVLALVLCFVMPFSYKNITKSIFVPTPYKNIKTDTASIAFPTTNYLSNSWFMGKRSFRFAATNKKAQMQSIKEGVNMPSLRSELLNLMELYPTIKPSIYVWDYETQNYIDINASETFSTASIIKVPVLIELFKSIEAGDISLNETMPLTEYYRSEGSGNLQFKARNSKWTIDELANKMITESDNSATNMLMSKVGSMTDINQAIRNWGLKNTEVQTWLPDLGGNNHTTAREMATMLYNIYSNDKFLSEASRKKILYYMSHVHNDRLIQAGLGAGSIFYHKTGDIGSMLGDAGIVVAPDGTKYIAVILAQRPHNDIAGKDFIVHASEIIYNYMVK